MTAMSVFISMSMSFASAPAVALASTDESQKENAMINGVAPTTMKSGIFVFSVIAETSVSFSHPCDVLSVKVQQPSKCNC